MKVLIIHNMYGSYEYEGCNVDGCYLVSEEFNDKDLTRLNVDYYKYIDSLLEHAKNNPGNVKKNGQLKLTVERAIKKASPYIGFLDTKLKRIDFIEG